MENHNLTKDFQISTLQITIRKMSKIIEDQRIEIEILQNSAKKKDK